MRLATVILGLFALAIAIILAVFVSPTPYRLLRVELGGPQSAEMLLVGARQHGITGRVEWLVYPVGWIEAVSGAATGRTASRYVLASLGLSPVG